MAQDWYRKNRVVSGRLRVGVVLDQELRSHSDPAPSELVRRLSPVPPGSRYLVIGDQLVLADGNDYVHDVIRLATPR